MEAENKYSRGKIYKLVPKVWEGDDFLTYIGSSCEPYLSRRLQKHKGSYNKYLKDNNNYTTSFKLFETYGIDNIEIVLLEDYPCETKADLHSRERFHIENNECVNKKIPLRTQKEWKKDKDYEINYRLKNKEKLKDYMKNY